MKKIGIYFGTDTGRTRRIAKLIAQKLDGRADAQAAAPLNINRVTLDDFLAHEVLILGAPTDGYRFKASQAVIDGRFVGPALDQISQPAQSEARIDAWLLQLTAELQTMDLQDART